MNKILAKHYDVFWNPAPCDNCWHRQRCKEELLACEVFYVYVLRNRHWEKERSPNKKWWDKIFVHDRDDEHDELEDKI
jgi:hypothetical protein